MKKIIFPALIIIAIVGSFLFVFRQRPGETKPEVKGGNNFSVILFYGETCPHCKKVEEWLVDHPQIEKNVNLVKKEVYYNQENGRELAAKAKECNIDESQGIGVPFLYDNGKCLVGDQPIIDYLSSKYQ